MCEQYPSLLCCPFQNDRVFLSSQPHILHTNNIQIGISPKQSPHNVVIEILIRNQKKHGYLFLRAKSLSRIPFWSNRF